MSELSLQIEQISNVIDGSIIDSNDTEVLCTDGGYDFEFDMSNCNDNKGVELVDSLVCMEIATLDDEESGLFTIKPRYMNLAMLSTLSQYNIEMTTGLLYSLDESF